MPAGDLDSHQSPAPIWKIQQQLSSMPRPRKPTSTPTRVRRRVKQPSSPPAAAGTEAPSTEERSGAGFPIVGVGASAGGLDAFTALLRALPPNTGLAFVLVQHLDPTHPSMLSDILSQATKMPVTEVRPETKVQPDHVYVIPPDRSMVIAGGVLKLSSRSQTAGQFRPIDTFLRSLAEDQKHQAIGVILSGGATDGTLGLEEIKAEGGVTFAQDSSAQHESMPRSASMAGCVDFVLAPSAIAKELASIAKHGLTVPNDAQIVTVVRDQDLYKLLHLLRTKTGVDFSNYKRNTLLRRITRRMVLHKHEGLSDYVRFVQSTPNELEALYQDILISVTSFFRNPDSFEVLNARVLPQIAKDRAHDNPIRMWVLGCSTGEEAYSLAITVSEFLDARPRQRQPVQIFASDLNPKLIEKARAGFYSKHIANDVSPERLRRWFIEQEAGYRVIKPLRDMVVFAHHNSLIDAPFSRMDLISCRNVLIYLDSVLQQRLVHVLHYALKPGGFLWLGTSESVGASRELFEVEDAKHKVYSRKPGRPSVLGHIRMHRDESQREAGTVTPRDRSIAGKAGAVDTQKEADRLILTRYAPPGVLVTSDFDILQFRGDTGPFLAPAPGRASLSLLKMAREGLVVALRNAVNKAKRTHAVVREQGLRVRSNGGFRTVHVEVIPIASNSEESYLVLFEEPAAQSARRSVAPKSRAASQAKPRDEVAKIKEELEATREHLHAVIEQKEAANEELQSANEEVQSANEELQTINEELETSKEEVQSSSEELATVNDELNHRNAELSLTNNDLVNLIASVQMAIVIVGRDLRIRRFSPRAEKMFNLITADVGRRIADITPRVGISDLEQMLLQSIDTIQPVEQEVQDPQGHWYSLRIRPYRTLDNTIDGAVVVLVDIDALKQTETVMHRQAALLERTQEPILMWRLDGPVIYWNKAAQEMYGLSQEEALGKLRTDLFATDVPSAFLLEALQKEGKWAGELVQRLRDGSKIVVECRMWLVQENGAASVLETHHAVTERKLLERALRTRASELALADLRKNEFLAMLAHELRNPLAPLGSALRLVEQEVPATGIASEALRVMQRQLHNLTRLVDDLIDVARVTQKKIELRTEPLELRQFLTEIAEDIQPILDARGQELDVALGDHAMYVDADPTRLEQVFDNLIGNASKYSEEGSRIRLTLDQNAAGDAAVVTVVDSGIGIAAEDLPRVFDLFVQGEAGASRRGGGLGIGLTLSRELVNLHGGAIEAHSAGRNRGSEFVVRLPLIQKPASSRPTTAESKAVAPNGSVRRVLVVDDNVDAAQSLAAVLRLYGRDVEVATSGREALEVAAEFHPEAVVMDLGMPEMDGYEVARKLRKRTEVRPRLLIALSGYGQVDHRLKAREAGFDHHFTKPVDLDELLALIGATEPG